jgi:hypothetical protein
MMRALGAGPQPSSVQGFRFRPSAITSAGATWRRYRSVTARLAWPSSCWITLTGTPSATCESWLRQNDDRWSPTLAEIRETYDEQKTREGITRHGKQEQESLVALALANWRVSTWPRSRGR